MLGADPPPPQLDAFEYWRLGGQIAAGDWLLKNELGAFRAPGYPVFLALFHRCGAYGLFSTFVVQHLLVIATSLTTAAVCGRITGRTGAALAAYALSVLCYSRDWHANLVLSETLFTFLLIGAIAATVHYFGRPSAPRAALIGLIIGLATLVRPIGTYVWFVVAISMIAMTWLAGGTGQARRSHDWGRTALQIAALVLATYVALAPWLLRNQLLFGSPFMTKFLGRNLWVVTFEKQSGAGLELGDGPASSELKQRLSGVDVPVVVEDTWSVSSALRVSGLPDDEIDALMLRVCRELIWEAPAVAGYKTVRRTANFWRCVSNPFPFYEWNPDQPSYHGQRIWKSSFATQLYRQANRYAASRSLRMNELALIGVVIGLACLLMRPATRPVAISLGLLLLYFNAVTAALEIPSYRYRLILEPVMIVCVISGPFALVFPQRQYDLTDQA